MRFAAVGFLIGEILCGYTFYANSHANVPINEDLYLVLCPPSIGGMALENAGVIGGIIGWLGFSIMNALLYGIPGFALDHFLKTTKQSEPRA